jgi:hypothetical protein
VADKEDKKDKVVADKVVANKVVADKVVVMGLQIDKKNSQDMT